MANKVKNLNDSKIALKDIEKDYELADFSLALEYKKKNMIATEDGNQYEICVETDEFKKYGVGVKLFFDFLRLSAFVFWIMALCSIPALYSNITGDGLAVNFQSSSKSITATTVANQPQLVYTSGSTDAEKAQELSDWQSQMQERIYWLTVPDIAYTVIFLLFIWIYSRKSKEIKYQIDEETAQPNQFTVQVENIPPKLNKPEILQQLFSQFGKVTGVYYAKNYNGMLSYYTKVSQLKYKLKFEEKKQEAKKKKGQETLTQKYLQKQLESAQDNIKKLSETKLQGISSHDDFPSLFAFVTFDTIEAKEACIKVYEQAWSLCGDRPNNLKIQDQILPFIVKKVDNPSNIKWENLDVTTAGRFFRGICVALILLLVMAATIVLVFAANLSKPTSSQDCPVTKFTRAEATANGASDYTINCYCLSLSLDTIYNDAELKTLCTDTIKEYFFTIGFSIAIAVAISLVNFLLKIVINALSSFSRYRTVTNQTLSSMTKLFVAMFVNSAIISLLLSANIYSFVPAREFSTNVLVFVSQSNTKYYADFDREWYISVGTKIMYTCISLMISPHVMNCVLNPCFRCMRERKARTSVLQQDMNEHILGPVFDVTQYYAVALNMIFITLLYCSVMPILLAMCAISLTLQYWSYKYLFLRYNKRPPTYDTSLNKAVIQILPYGAFLHIIVAIFMYGNSSLFVQTDLSITSNVTAQGDSYGSDQGLYQRVIYNPINIIFFIIAALMLLFYILNRTLFILFRGLYSILCFCCKSKKVRNYKFKSYTQEFENISKRMIPTYNILENETYNKLVSAMQTKN